MCWISFVHCFDKLGSNNLLDITWIVFGILDRRGSSNALDITRMVTGQ